MANDPTFLGTLTVKQSKAGKKYFKGFLFNLPIVGFPTKKDPCKVFFKIDIQYLNKLTEQGQDEGEQSGGFNSGEASQSGEGQAIY